MTERKKKAPAKSEQKPAATPAQLEAGVRARERVGNLPLRVEPHVTLGETCQIESQHADESGMAYMFMDTLSSASNQFISRQLRSILNVTGEHGKAGTSEDLGSALAFVAAVQPANEMEAALAVQMYAAHHLALDMLERAKNAKYQPQLECYGNLATKAQRTFTAQIEALTKLRTGGKQIVEHRHYNIDNRGGQAVIAENMHTGGSRNGRNAANQSHALSAPLPSEDPEGFSLPSPTDQRAQKVSNARG